MILANDLTNNPEMLSYLLEIAKNAAQITHYLASSTRAWYNIVNFVESNMFFLTFGAGAVIGYLFGRK